MVFLNETKNEVPKNAFTKHTALSSTSNEMAGGVALLLRYNVSIARIKDLDTKDKENHVAAANIRGRSENTNYNCLYKTWGKCYSI